MKTLNKIIAPEDLQFVEKVSPAEINRLLIDGKTTGVAVIGCSEIPEIDAGFPSGKEFPLYLWQNFGGCVCDCSGLDYLITEKAIENVIVVGHYPCEIVEVGIRENFEDSMFSHNLIKHFRKRTRETQKAAHERFGTQFDKEILLKATEDFTLRQVALFLETPNIKSSIQQRKLKVHAWIYNEETSAVTSFDSQEFRFVPVERSYSSDIHFQTNEN